MGKMIIRDAMADDAAVILAVQREANEPYRHRPRGPSGPFHDTVAGTEAAMATAPVVVATVDGMVVGCLFFAHEETHCYLFRLAVLPAYQRRGIGRALIAEVEGRVRTKGLPMTRLGVRRAMQENRR
jgi:ribosomal protein S18 acetylase RimI-like enzyme